MTGPDLLWQTVLQCDPVGNANEVTIRLSEATIVGKRIGHL